MASEVEIILRFVLASVLGGVIGLEREVHGREAGVRTYLLVSLGSALIMVVSEFLPVKYQDGPLEKSSGGIRDVLQPRPSLELVSWVRELSSVIETRYAD